MTQPDTGCAACGRGLENAPLRFPALSIRQCANCGLVFADQNIYRVDPSALYGESYFRGQEYDDYPRDRAALELNFRGVREKVRKWNPRGRLLEVGCAYGFFLNLCRGAWEAEGLDVSGDAVRYARDTLGVAARCGDFLEEAVEPQAYDAICLWDTLEHLRRPQAYVEKASRSLRPGGTLFLTTGDIGSWVARLRGARWRLVHPPTHLFYFDRRTIRLMLERHGLEIVELRSQGYYRTLGAMLKQTSLRFPPGPFRRFLEHAARFPPFLSGIYLNLFDIMFVAARRPMR